MPKLGVQSDLDLTIFKNGQFWCKTPQNGRLLKFSTLSPKNTKFYFPLSFSMAFLAIQAIFFEKRQKIWISAFSADFQKNGSRYAKIALRNPWDESYG